MGTAAVELVGTPRADRGFALVDLIGGLSILLVAIGGVYGMAVQGANERRIAAQECIAFEGCRIKLEELRTLPIAALPGEDGTRFDVDVDGNGQSDLEPTADNPTGMPGLVRVTVAESSGGEAIYRVRADITWEGMTGRRTLGLETLITNRFGQ
jgi:hypothetical protein